MDTFRTIVGIEQHSKKITYKTPVMLLGSCFTDYIGDRLSSYKFPVVHNPFGVLYNPASVRSAIDRLISGRLFTTEDLGFYKGLWFSFSHSTAFSRSGRQQCLDEINRGIKSASEHLYHAEFLFITLGTAWVFEYKKTGQIVANCHKIPAKEFNRYLLGADQVVTSYNTLIEQIRNRNPRIHIILTVSPVRHLKDGAVGNQISKATLLLAAHQLVNKHENVYYFPAYEIFMDELRDYRFYSEDMLHPSASGIAYTWQRFEEIFIDNSVQGLMKEIERIRKIIEHRPFYSGSDEYQQLLTVSIEKCRNLEKQYNFTDFSKEIGILHGRLTW